MQVVHWAIIVHTGSRTRPPASAHSAALGSRFSDTQPLHRITHSTGLLASQDYSLSHSHSHFTGSLTSQDYSLQQPLPRITHSLSHFTGLLTHTATSQDYLFTHLHSHFTGLLTHSLIQPLHRIIHSLKELECQEGQIPSPKYAHSHKPQFLMEMDTNPRRPMKPEGC